MGITCTVGAHFSFIFQIASHIWIVALYNSRVSVCGWCVCVCSLCQIIYFVVVAVDLHRVGPLPCWLHRKKSNNSNGNELYACQICMSSNRNFFDVYRECGLQYYRNRHNGRSNYKTIFRDKDWLYFSHKQQQQNWLVVVAFLFQLIARLSSGYCFWYETTGVFFFISMEPPANRFYRFHAP